MILEIFTARRFVIIVRLRICRCLRTCLTSVVQVLECSLVFFVSFTIRCDHEHANREFRYMTGWLLHFRGEEAENFVTCILLVAEYIVT